MRGQHEELSCPFCEKGKVEAWYIPATWSFKRKSTKTLPGPGTPIKSKDVWIIKSGCNVCGKSQEEVEKELRKQRII